MRRIVCEDCKKRYDYDKEEFCPRCGAFNQPVKTWGMDSQGNVVRVDGVNERNHAGSFAHREVHKEKTIRRVAGMDQSGRRPPQPRQPVQPSRQAQASRPAPRPPQSPQWIKPMQKGEFPERLKTALWLLAIILLFNLILPILIALM